MILNKKFQYLLIIFLILVAAFFSLKYFDGKDNFNLKEAKLIFLSSENNEEFKEDNSYYNCIVIINKDSSRKEKCGNFGINQIYSSYQIKNTPYFIGDYPFKQFSINTNGEIEISYPYQRNEFENFKDIDLANRSEHILHNNNWLVSLGYGGFNNGSEYFRISYKKIGTEKWKKVEFNNNQITLVGIYQDSLIYFTYIPPNSEMVSQEYYQLDLNTGSSKRIKTVEQINLNLSNLKYNEIPGNELISVKDNILTYQITDTTIKPYLVNPPSFEIKLEGKAIDLEQNERPLLNFRKNNLIYIVTNKKLLTFDESINLITSKKVDLSEFLVNKVKYSNNSIYFLVEDDKSDRYIKQYSLLGVLENSYYLNNRSHGVIGETFEILED